jgi:hypothetical protein
MNSVKFENRKEKEREDTKTDRGGNDHFKFGDGRTYFQHAASYTHFQSNTTYSSFTIVSKESLVSKSSSKNDAYSHNFYQLTIKMVSSQLLRLSWNSLKLTTFAITDSVGFELLSRC